MFHEWFTFRVVMMNKVVGATAAALAAVAIGLLFGVMVGRQSKRTGSSSTTPAVASSPRPTDSVGELVEEVALIAKKADASLASLHEASEAARAASPLARTGRADDPDWSSLPRTEFTIGGWAIALRTHIDVDRLFRNKTLNPRDDYICPAQRDMLKSLVSAIEPRLRELDAFHRKHVLQEAMSMRSRVPVATAVPARSTTLVDGRVVEVDTYAPGDGYEVFLPSKNGMDVIRQMDLPTTRTALELRAFLVTDLGLAVLEWFVAQGTCPESTIDGARKSLANVAVSILR